LTRRKKQPVTSVAELAKGDEEKRDILFVTDRLVSNKDIWIIDLEVQHISPGRKMFSSHTSVQGGEVFIGNSTTSKVIGEETIQFRSNDG